MLICMFGWRKRYKYEEKIFVAFPLTLRSRKAPHGAFFFRKNHDFQYGGFSGTSVRDKGKWMLAMDSALKNR